MNISNLPTPTTEGVYGPELLLNVATGDGCERREDGTLDGAPPQTPATNAFLVWVGRPVLVVSEGVGQPDYTTVAKKLRARLQAKRLPVIFCLGKHPSGLGVSIAVDQAEAAQLVSEELARAEGYALVQLAWEEEAVTVHVGRETYRFTVSFVQTGGGDYQPVLTASH